MNRKTIRWRVEDRGHETPCWAWLLVCSHNGYPQHWNGERLVYAHRWLYEQQHGPIPTGLDLDHLCRVRECVNPDHLEPVTRRTNLLRGNTITAANAAKTQCPQGHPYDEANTYVRANGSRVCRACNREQNRVNYHVRRAREATG